MNKTKGENKTLAMILTELRMLRSELELLIPKEELRSYTHAGRLRASYQRAIKLHPSLPAWK